TNDMIEAIQKRQTTSFRNKYRRAEFLLIDDIQFIAGRESTQEEFFHTFNTLYGQGKQIILSCDRAPEELADLQERLKNRFLGGMIAKIDPPDIELREAVLLSKIKSAGMQVDFPVIRTLAKNLGPSIRELEGALLRLAAISRLTSQRIDHTLVEKVVDLRNGAKDPLSSVVQTVADYFSIEVADLKGPRRSKDRVFPRQIAMYLIREVSDLSFKAIAKHFGGKDHTTVMYSISKVEKAVKNSTETADLVEEIRMRALNGE
ncbi:chromosomal replication initiator protein DnaA, partial [Patescibacteria group bacterium]|nr:chromosomal replication initiator protein DnaA [Patescibacteria group bacterium]